MRDLIKCKRNSESQNQLKIVQKRTIIFIFKIKNSLLALLLCGLNTIINR
jgi:hypothetical protein